MSAKWNSWIDRGDDGTLTISALVGDNGSPVSLTKNGPGASSSIGAQPFPYGNLNVPSSYSGNTYINQGTLIATGSQQQGSTLNGVPTDPGYFGSLGTGNIVFTGDGTLRPNNNYSRFSDIDGNTTINAAVTATIDGIGTSYFNNPESNIPGPSPFIGGAGGIAFISSKGNANNYTALSAPEAQNPPSVYSGPTTVVDTFLDLAFNANPNPPQSSFPYYLPINGKNILNLGGALGLDNESLNPESINMALSTGIKLIADTSSQIVDDGGGGTFSLSSGLSNAIVRRRGATLNIGIGSSTISVLGGSLSNQNGIIGGWATTGSSIFTARA